MAVTLIGTRTISAPGNGTTSSLDTTGLSLLVVSLSFLDAGGTPAISDSYSNTWVPLTKATTVVSGANQLFYVANPTGGTGHTFTVSTSAANTLIAAAFSGIKTVSPFDGQGPGGVDGVSATAITGGPLVSTSVNELFVTGFEWENSDSGAVISNSYSVTDSISFVNADHYGGAFAWKVEPTSGTSVSPVWTNGNNGRRTATLASFISSEAVSYSVSDSNTLSDSIRQNRGYLFSDSESFAEAALAGVTGAVPGGDLVSDYLSLQDSVTGNFGVAPPLHRGNIDYDQIRVAARAGDGAKFHTLTGSLTTGHTVVADANGNLIDAGAVPGVGTVSSVAQTVPSGFTVAGSPITSSGTLAITADSQAANKFYASPDGSSGSPTFRVVAAGDLPLGSSSAFGAVKVDNTTISASSGVISSLFSAPALVLLEQHSASSSASLDFTTTISATYDEYVIIVQNLIPASDNVDLQWLASTNGGSSYDTGNNYNWSRFGFDGGGSSTAGGASVAFIRLVGGIDLSTSYGVSGVYNLSAPGSAIFKKIYGQCGYQNNGNSIGMEFGNGVYKITTAVNAFRFLFSSGNIASGLIRTYGVKK